MSSELMKLLLEAVRTSAENVGVRVSNDAVIELLRRNSIQIREFIRSVTSVKDVTVHVTKNGDVFLVRGSKSLYLGNLRTYERIVSKLKRGEIEIAPVDQPSRYRRVTSDVKRIDEDVETIDSDVEVVENDVEVIISDSEFFGQPVLEREFPEYYELERLERQKRIEEKFRLVEQIAKMYPTIFSQYRDTITRLVLLGVIKHVPRSEYWIIHVLEKYKEFRQLYPRSWKYRLQLYVANTRKMYGPVI